MKTKEDIKSPVPQETAQRFREVASRLNEWAEALQVPKKCASLLPQIQQKLGNQTISELSEAISSLAPILARQQHILLVAALIAEQARFGREKKCVNPRCMVLRHQAIVKRIGELVLDSSVEPLQAKDGSIGYTVPQINARSLRIAKQSTFCNANDLRDLERLGVVTCVGYDKLAGIYRPTEQGIKDAAYLLSDRTYWPLSGLAEPIAKCLADTNKRKFTTLELEKWLRARSSGPMYIVRHLNLMAKEGLVEPEQRIKVEGMLTTVWKVTSKMSPLIKALRGAKD